MQESLLTDQQRSIVEAVQKGQNVFFTGPAGVGKSFTLSCAVDTLRKANKQVYVTAATGVAALAVGGTTLHSFAGIGLGQGTVTSLMQKLQKRSDIKRKWCAADVLIVDEISMIDGVLLDKIEHIARLIRKSQKPFGGLQILFTGDFAQLPPVSKRGEAPKLFAFESDCWNRVVQKTVHLSRVFRQQNETFVQHLHEIRRGLVTKETLELLKGRVGIVLPDDGIRPTKLYSHRYDVEQENTVQLEALPGQAQVYVSVDTGKAGAKKTLDKQCLAKKELKLKVGAQVVLLKNLDATRELVNGSRGIVTKLGLKSVEVLFKTGPFTVTPQSFRMMEKSECLAERKQLPLMLGYAMSIHKAQGMSIDRAEIDLSKVFEYGQAYVALSRVTSLEGLRILRSFDPGVLKANSKVLAYYESIDRADEPPLKKKKE